MLKAVRACRRLHHNAYGSRLPLPTLDVVALLNKRHSPPVADCTIDKTAAVVYCVWQHGKTNRSVAELAQEVNANSHVVVTYWVKKYCVYKKRTTNQRKIQSKTKRHAPEFKLRAKALHDAGYITYRAIAKQMGCDETVIALVAQEDGWSHKAYRGFEWVEATNVPENTIDTYEQYKRTIRHYTKKIRENQLTPEQQRLVSTTHDIDHKLSVWEAFHRGEKPLPWQLICHPANLQIITTAENTAKGRNSDITPAQLMQLIKRYEKKHGKVLLPSITSERDFSRRLAHQSGVIS